MIIDDLNRAPTGHYGTILIDAPWCFATYSAKGCGRSPDAHFDPMSIEALRVLPIQHIAKADAVLFCWAVSWMLPGAIDMMERWGFPCVSTGFVWVKTMKSDPRRLRHGLGFTTRKACEVCLLGRRGHPKRLNKDVSEIIMAPRGLPMQKPVEQYDRIERLYAGPYIEMFARRTRPGWDSWGNEVGLLDNGAVRTRRIPSGRAPQVRVGPGGGVTNQTSPVAATKSPTVV